MLLQSIKKGGQVVKHVRWNGVVSTAAGVGNGGEPGCGRQLGALVPASRAAWSNDRSEATRAPRGSDASTPGANVGRDPVR